MRKVSNWCCFVLILLMGIALTSCRTQYVGISDDMFIRDTVVVNRLQQERIYQHDSIFTDRYYCSDTAYIVREKWTVQVKEKLVHDSIYINHTDTVVKKVVEKTEKRLTWWQNARMHLGGICFWLIIIAMVLFILKRWYK